MFTSETSGINAARGLTRRAVFGLAAIAALPFGRAALASTGVADAVATIQQFNGALLAAMKSGEQTPFGRRFQALSPAVEQAFDLHAVLQVSIGPTWGSLAPQQQERLLQAFTRYTIASYAANFSSYNGQKLVVSPETRGLEAGRVLVQSQIVPITGDATQLDYVMQQVGSKWKVVDVLAAGSISRVAVQHSDFRHLLARGGGDALLASLQHKATDLSGGALT